MPIFKDEDGTNHNQFYLGSFITAPAVNAGVMWRREPSRVTAIESIMRKKIVKVLAIAIEHSHQTIVLGALGCGVFMNDPIDIASYFKDIRTTQFKDEFRKIVFAVYSRNEKFITPFYKEFGY